MLFLLERRDGYLNDPGRHKSVRQELFSATAYHLPKPAAKCKSLVENYYLNKRIFK